tara:strand:- start:2162 stop:2386 length:225 start_codon:yes stop_codon:yes gene_type:complete
LLNVAFSFESDLLRGGSFEYFLGPQASKIQNATGQMTPLAESQINSVIRFVAQITSAPLIKKGIQLGITDSVLL